MKRDWLTRRMDLGQFADGRNRALWKRLSRLYQPGDELWEFCSPPESWRYLAGRAGVSLVRDGAIVESVVTRMN